MKWPVYMVGMVSMIPLLIFLQWGLDVELSNYATVGHAFWWSICLICYGEFHRYVRNNP